MNFSDNNQTTTNTKECWKMKNLFLMVLAVSLLLTASVFSAAGYRHILLIPGWSAAELATSDSTWGDMDDGGINGVIDLSAMKNVESYILRVLVSSNHEDVDSIECLTRMHYNHSDTGGWIVIDSQEVAGGTYLSTITKEYAVDSAAGMYPYLQTIARVFGDAAGTAIKTIRISTAIVFLDGQGQVIEMKKWLNQEVSFQE